MLIADHKSGSKKTSAAAPRPGVEHVLMRSRVPIRGCTKNVDTTTPLFSHRSQMKNECLPELRSREAQWRTARWENKTQKKTMQAPDSASPAQRLVQQQVPHQTFPPHPPEIGEEDAAPALAKQRRDAAAGSFDVEAEGSS